MVDPAVLALSQLQTHTHAHASHVFEWQVVLSISTTNIGRSVVVLGRRKKREEAKQFERMYHDVQFIYHVLNSFLTSVEHLARYEVVSFPQEL